MDSMHINELEECIGSKLPDDYADFLSSHTDGYLDSPLVFDDPRSGVVDELFTSKDIVQNSIDNCLGIPDKGLVHIGSNIMGGYLYIKLSSDGFGELHYSENNNFQEHFPSFSAFLRESHDECA